MAVSLRFKSPNLYILPVKVTPRSGKNAIKALSPQDDVLSVHVRAVPEAGQANTALIALLSEALSLPKGAIEVIKGQSARHKQVQICFEEQGALLLTRLAQATQSPESCFTILL